MPSTLDDNAALVRLRTCFAQPPSPETWEAVCACFDVPAGWGGEVALAYAQEHLARWPDALRRAPDAWLDRIADGGPLPLGWPLVRHLSRVGAPSPLARRRGLGRLLARIDPGALTQVTLDEGPLADGDLDALTSAGRAWTGLTALSLALCGLRADAMTRLLTAPALGHVRRLVLEGNAWDDPAPWPGDAPGADGSLELDVGACAMGAAGVGVLGASRWMRRVSTLRAARNGLGDHGATLAPWSEAPAMAHLRALDLAFNGLTLDALAPLLGAPPAPLRALHLAANPLDAACLRALAASPLAGTLEALDVSMCDLDDDAARALGAAPWAALARLDLSANALTNDALAPLLGGALSARLRHLNLACNDLGPGAPPALLRPHRLPRLEALDLRRNRLDDDALRALRDAWADAPTHLTL